PLPAQPFVDPDPFQELTFANAIAAKKAIADYLALPLAKLPPEQLDFINTLVANTLEKHEVMTQVRNYFSVLRRKSPC
ncbi:MAG TPA: IS481 family transposase, partial [Candidatus Competibacteraceae bacterium]|nr:IS481 family transposase [Candidatus Competibacteraceae bacterium]